MAFETLLCETRDDGIALLTLNRPEKRNALSRQLRGEIVECLNRARRRRCGQGGGAVGAG